jgi:hypothetical protein
VAVPPQVAVLDAAGRIVALNEAWREAAGQAFAENANRIGDSYVDAVMTHFPGVDRLIKA